MEIDILIEDPSWDRVDLISVAERAFHQAFLELGLNPNGFEVSILACDDARVSELNAEFRGKSTPTNVLSWPSEDRAPEYPGDLPKLPTSQSDGPLTELGDIALAYGTLEREAAGGDKPFEHHLLHLLVHGLLHLLGFDHIEDADAAQMERIETQILARLGVPDPY